MSNNSFIAFETIEPVLNPTEKYQEEEARTVRILEALEEVQKTRAWSTLKNEVFDRLVGSLEKDLRAEAKKEDPDPKKLNRLSGELKWAEKYADLTKLEDSFKLNLQRIRTRLHGTSD